MTRKVIAFIALILIAVLYQTLLADQISIGFARPDIILILIVWLTLTRDLTWGVVFAFVAGVLEDSHSPQFMGLGAFLKIACTLAVFILSHRVRTDRLAIKILMVIAVVILHDILYFLIAYSFDLSVELSTLHSSIIPSALYTSVIAAGVLYLSERQITIRFES